MFSLGLRHCSRFYRAFLALQCRASRTLVCGGGAANQGIERSPQRGTWLFRVNIFSGERISYTLSWYPMVVLGSYSSPPPITYSRCQRLETVCPPPLNHRKRDHRHTWVFHFTNLWPVLVLKKVYGIILQARTRPMPLRRKLLHTLCRFYDSDRISSVFRARPLDAVSLKSSFHKSIICPN